MSSPQYRELLAKSQIFKKDLVTSAEDSKDRTYQESDGVYHARVLSHFHCGRQRSILLKSQADRILANDNSVVWLVCFVRVRPIASPHQPLWRGLHTGLR